MKIPAKTREWMRYAELPSAFISERRLHSGGTSGPSCPIRLFEHFAYPASLSFLPSSLASPEGFVSDSSLLHVGLFSPPMGLICASCFWNVAKKMQEQSQLKGLGHVGPAVPLRLSSAANSSTFFCSSPHSFLPHPPSVNLVFVLFCAIMKW